MAESQQIYPYNDIVATKSRAEEIEKNLSQERLLPYFNESNMDWNKAYNLYLYNSRLSKSFLYPLHILEVTLRNKMHDLFSSEFDGSDWPNNQNFILMLNDKSKASLDNAKKKVPNRSTEDVIAALSFDFWSNILFRGNYSDFWRLNFSKIKTSAPNFKAFKASIKASNDLRNRIAHHEPIHRLDCSSLHYQILNTLNWLSDETYKWTKEHSTVPLVIRTKPAASGNPQPLLKAKADSNFTEVISSLTLDQLPDEEFIICTDKNIIITLNDIALYLLSKKEGQCLILELTDHSLEDIITSCQLKRNYIECDEGESYAHTKKIFNKKSNKFILVKSKSVTSVGVIKKPHRQI